MKPNNLTIEQTQSALFSSKNKKNPACENMKALKDSIEDGEKSLVTSKTQGGGVGTMPSSHGEETNQSAFIDTLEEQKEVIERLMSSTKKSKEEKKEITDNDTEKEVGKKEEVKKTLMKCVGEDFVSVLGSNFRFKDIVLQVIMLLLFIGLLDSVSPQLFINAHAQTVTTPDQTFNPTDTTDPGGPFANPTNPQSTTGIGTTITGGTSLNPTSFSSSTTTTQATSQTSISPVTGINNFFLPQESSKSKHFRRLDCPATDCLDLTDLEKLNTINLGRLTAAECPRRRETFQVMNVSKMASPSFRQSPSICLWQPGDNVVACSPWFSKSMKISSFLSCFTVHTQDLGHLREVKGRAVSTSSFFPSLMVTEISNITIQMESKTMKSDFEKTMLQDGTVIYTETKKPSTLNEGHCCAMSEMELYTEVLHSYLVHRTCSNHGAFCFPHFISSEKTRHRAFSSICNSVTLQERLHFTVFYKLKGGVLFLETCTVVLLTSLSCRLFQLLSLVSSFRFEGNAPTKVLKTLLLCLYIFFVLVTFPLVEFLMSILFLMGSPDILTKLLRKMVTEWMNFDNDSEKKFLKLVKATLKTKSAHLNFSETPKSSNTVRENERQENDDANEPTAVPENKDTEETSQKDLEEEQQTEQKSSVTEQAHKKHEEDSEKTSEEEAGKLVNKDVGKQEANNTTSSDDEHETDPAVDLEWLLSSSTNRLKKLCYSRFFYCLIFILLYPHAILPLQYKVQAQFIPNLNSLSDSISLVPGTKIFNYTAEKMMVQIRIKENMAPVRHRSYSYVDNGASELYGISQGPDSEITGGISFDKVGYSGTPFTVERQWPGYMVQNGYTDTQKNNLQNTFDGSATCDFDILTLPSGETVNFVSYIAQGKCSGTDAMSYSSCIVSSGTPEFKEVIFVDESDLPSLSADLVLTTPDGQILSTSGIVTGGRSWAEVCKCFVISEKSPGVFTADCITDDIYLLPGQPMQNNKKGIIQYPSGYFFPQSTKKTTKKLNIFPINLGFETLPGVCQSGTQSVQICPTGDLSTCVTVNRGVSHHSLVGIYEIDYNTIQKLPVQNFQYIPDTQVTPEEATHEILVDQAIWNKLANYFSDNSSTEINLPSGYPFKRLNEQVRCGSLQETRQSIPSDIVDSPVKKCKGRVFTAYTTPKPFFQGKFQDSNTYNMKYEQVLSYPSGICQDWKTEALSMFSRDVDRECTTADASVRARIVETSVWGQEVSNSATGLLYYNVFFNSLVAKPVVPKQAATTFIIPALYDRPIVVTPNFQSRRANNPLSNWARTITFSNCSGNYRWLNVSGETVTFYKFICYGENTYEARVCGDDQCQVVLCNGEGSFKFKTRPTGCNFTFDFAVPDIGPMISHLTNQTVLVDSQTITQLPAIVVKRNINPPKPNVTSDTGDGSFSDFFAAVIALFATAAAVIAAAVLYALLSSTSCMSTCLPSCKKICDCGICMKNCCGKCASCAEEVLCVGLSCCAAKVVTDVAPNPEDKNQVEQSNGSKAGGADTVEDVVKEGSLPNNNQETDAGEKQHTEVTIGNSVNYGTQDESPIVGKSRSVSAENQGNRQKMSKEQRRYQEFLQMQRLMRLAPRAITEDSEEEETSHDEEDVGSKYFDDFKEAKKRKQQNQMY